MPHALIFRRLAAFPSRDLAAAEGKVASVDPYTNGTSHHSTDVEPDTGPSQTRSQVSRQAN